MSRRHLSELCAVALFICVSLAGAIWSSEWPFRHTKCLPSAFQRLAGEKRKPAISWDWESESTKGPMTTSWGCYWVTTVADSWCMKLVVYTSWAVVLNLQNHKDIQWSSSVVCYFNKVYRRESVQGWYGTLHCQGPILFPACFSAVCDFHSQVHFMVQVCCWCFNLSVGKRMGGEEHAHPPHLPLRRLPVSFFRI